MRYLILIAAALIVTGCEDRVSIAKRHYEVAKERGSSDDRCAAARELKTAYLDADDVNEYAIAVSAEPLDCPTQG